MMQMMMKFRFGASRRLLLPCLLLLLSGCSIFGGKGGKKADEEEKTDPYPLVKFAEEVAVKSLWRLDVGRGLEKKYGSLSPAVADGRIFAAGLDGRVIAASTDNGKPVWKADLVKLLGASGGKGRGGKAGDIISGGVGVGAGLVFVGTTNGELVALNQSDGSLAWRAASGSEVLSPPRASASLVVAQAVNGRVTALDLLTGARQWIYEAQVPPLSIRGTSSPLVNEDVVVCGFANGRVLLLDAAEGVPRWEHRIGVPQGQSELERLVDVDGRMLLLGSRLFVVSYQGRMLSIDLPSGRVVWGREASSFVGLDEGFGNIYVVLDDDRLMAIDQTSNREVWSIDSLRYRRLTTPTAIGNHVAVGDQQGYVHLIAQADGRFTGRTKVDGNGLVGQLVADGDRLYVQGKSGKLFALQVR